MSDTDLSVKEFATATGLSEKTVRRRVRLFERAATGEPIPLNRLPLAIPFRVRLGRPYRIPAEILPLFLGTQGPAVAGPKP